MSEQLDLLEALKRSVAQVEATPKPSIKKAGDSSPSVAAAAATAGKGGPKKAEAGEKKKKKTG